MKEYYLPWADENKTRSCEDHSRYRCWLNVELGKKLLKEITSFDIERIKNKMKKAGRADATIRHVIGLVRHAFNKAYDWHIYEGANPCFRVKLPQSNNARIRFLTRNEATVLLSELRQTSIQVAHVATFALYGGLRLGEVLSLKWGNVDEKHGIINVLETKNGQPRPLFITEPILLVLGEIRRGRSNQFIFKTRDGKHVAWLSNTYRRVVKKLGLNDNVIDRRQRVCFHTLRHTYASWAVMAGVPIFIVAKALGHKTIAMTQRYSHLAPDSHRVAFEAVANYNSQKK
jgi:integrase